MRVIGYMVVVGGLLLGVGLYLGYVDFSTHAKVTAKGQQTIQAIRNHAADKVRGK